MKGKKFPPHSRLAPYFLMMVVAKQLVSVFEASVIIQGGVTTWILFF